MISASRASRRRSMLATVLAALLLCCAAGCSDDGGAADAAGAVDSTAKDDSAARVDAGSDSSAAPDSAVPDTRAPDAACIPEDDSAICTRLGYACGQHAATDNCGKARSPDCGGCPLPLTCGAVAVGQCGFSGNPRFTYGVIDRQGDPGHGVSLAVATDGATHVCYGAKSPSDALRYASRPAGGTTWTPTAITSGVLSAEYCDIAVDVPHVASRSLGKPLLWTRASGTSGAWSSTAMSSLGGRHVALTIAPGGAAHACHTDSRGETLMHSYETSGGSFTTETVRGQPLSGQKVGDWCDIRVDLQATVHVSFDDLNWLRLGYAFKRSGDSTFTFEVAASDKAGKVGSYTALALDSSGAPVIAFFRSVDDMLAVSRRSGANSWKAAPLYKTGAIAAYTSMALDATGRLHLSYYDSRNGEIRYIPPNGPPETVAVVGTGSGGFNDLALDAKGKAHIVFYNATKKRLEVVSEN